jgi:hypothetical protein
MDYRLPAGKTERLVHICRELGAGVYLSGPSARGYLDEAAFARAGISVEWMDYSGYPEYPQLFPPFVHEVSIVDLILNTGARARDCIVRRAPATALRPVAPCGAALRARRSAEQGEAGA